MHVCFDIEANGLEKPTKIWCIVCKEVRTGEVTIFRGLTDDEAERTRFLSYAAKVTRWIGHNCLEYDFPVVHDLLGLSVPLDAIVDTLILSRLINYDRPGGHSIEQFGIEFGIPKGDNKKQEFFNKWSQELEDYCVRDVDICYKVYNKFLRVISDPSWARAIHLEHRFQLIVNDLHSNGFCFNSERASRLLEKVKKELGALDEKILTAFPPREVLIREFEPKATKYGTISKSSVPRLLHSRIHEYEVGKRYRHTKTEAFNPASHKQLIEVLNEAGWEPTDKTKTHIEAEREYNRLKRSDPKQADELKLKIDKLKVTGWQINENNLSTLPEDAPEGARLLAQRILLESRRRTLTEWLGLVKEDGRIHGRFYGIGAWTHRMAHRNPNTANIPREFLEDGSVKLYGKELRQLWCAPRNRLLVGVDAEGIQLRIFAHYIDDVEFTNALVNGKKADKSDPHSLNQRILGPACKTRQAAKRFIYALLLGGGINKLTQILGCSRGETEEALARLLERYQGFARLRKDQIPKDAKRGWFLGVDGRRVPIPGNSQRDREHLCMSGYLQNGEAIAVKLAAIITDDVIRKDETLSSWRFVNIVHDELQSEVKNSLDIAVKVAKIKADAIRQAGEELKLKCPLAGSYWNDDINDYTIGTNWYATH